MCRPLRSSTSSGVSILIDTLHEWPLNLNKNTVIHPKLVFMFPDKELLFFLLMRALGCCKYCYSNISAISDAVCINSLTKI